MGRLDYYHSNLDYSTPQDAQWALPIFYHRHPSENHSNENKIKAEELGNSWFTVDEIIKNDKFVSATTKQKSSTNQNQPIGEQLVLEGKTQFEKVLANESEVAIESKETKTNKTPLKQIVAIIQWSQKSERSFNSSDIASMYDERNNASG